jgi:hypothetical protein
MREMTEFGVTERVFFGILFLSRMPEESLFIMTSQATWFRPEIHLFGIELGPKEAS